MMVLIQRGILEPTAQQVADEAGIGIRTVFRQVQDKENLFLKMDEKVRATLQETLKRAANPRGNLEKRIEGLIELEAELFENNLQFLRATLANKWKYNTLQKNYERNQRNIKSLLYTWIPELKNLSESQQTLLTSINSAGYWIELRENLVLSVTGAKNLKINLFRDTLLN
jgi:AcrR family transcriptional regulator